MVSTDLPYISIGDTTLTVTTTPQLFDSNGKMSVLHNKDAILYYSSKSTVSSTSPELAIGEKTFVRTGKLYLVSASTSTVKIEYLDNFPT